MIVYKQITHLTLSSLAGPKVRVEDVPIPKPNDDQVLIKVVVSGSNPKDWKAPFWLNDENHQGDDIAGIVHEVGVNVTEFKPGDRVAAFHQMRTPHGSYAEYAIAWQHTTFHIPKTTSYEGELQLTSVSIPPDPVPDPIPLSSSSWQA